MVLAEPGLHFQEDKTMLQLPGQDVYSLMPTGHKGTYNFRMLLKSHPIKGLPEKKPNSASTWSWGTELWCHLIQFHQTVWHSLQWTTWVKPLRGRDGHFSSFTIGIGIIPENRCLSSFRSLSSFSCSSSVLTWRLTRSTVYINMYLNCKTLWNCYSWLHHC